MKECKEVFFTAEIHINPYTQEVIKNILKEKGKVYAVKWLKENDYANVSLTSLLYIVKEIAN